MRRLFKEIIGSTLTLVGLGLIAAAQALRRWLEFTALTYGLYEYCVDDICFPLPWTPSFDNYHLFTVRIILLVADVSLLTAFMSSLAAYCLFDSKRWKGMKVAGSLNIVAGSLVIVANITLTVLTLIRNATDVTVFSFGFCYIFGWVSGVLLIIGGVVQVLAGAPERAQRATGLPRVVRYTTSVTGEFESPPTNPYYASQSISTAGKPYYSYSQ